MWTSWMLLAACAVITQSFPHPSGEYQIPAVPRGARAQYYVLHNDGGFKYGYDTGVGAYESAVKMGSGDLTGFYGYKDAAGDDVRVDYIAGLQGFQPSGDHFPVAPEPGSVDVAPSAAVFKSAPAVAPVISSGPVEESEIFATNNLDGSYSFAYDNSESSRSESADTSNNVEGTYVVSFDDGNTQTVRYKAGAGIGFVAEGDGIPEAPVVPQAPTFHAAPAPVPVIPAPAPVTLYSAPVAPAAPVVHIVPQPVLHQTPAVQYSAAEETHEPRGDASYSFTYESDDSARQEDSDHDLNVKGSYSFVGDDGVRRTVNYVAGSETGFVAEGDHIPTADDVPAAVVSPSVAPVQPAFQQPPSFYSATGASQNAFVASEPRGDASYSFSYQTDDSARSESSDSDLNVKGEYSYTADDGVHRRVSYRAGSETGFVVDGEETSGTAVAPGSPVPATRSGFQAPSTGYATVGSPVPSTRSGFYPVRPSSTHAAAFKSGVSEDSNIASDSNVDGSYSFSYETAHSSRSETADSDNNVVGEYSFTADDGVNRKVNYRAGSATGFIAEGDHIPEAQDAPAAAVAPASAPAAPVPAPTLYVAPAAPSVSHVGSRGEHQAFGANQDASYSFSYNTDDSARSETSDGNLNVRGTYSFVADDGVERRVDYQAGSDTGFVAQGAHLPENSDASAVLSAVSSAISQAQPQAIVKSAPTGPVISHEEAVIRSGQAGGAYSFSYATDDSSRSETADSSNNVAGQYSFVADDGVNRQVQYRAGSGIGFVAQGDGIPEAPEAHVAPVLAVHAAAPAPAPATLYSAPVAQPAPTFHSSSGGDSRGDASYSFSYQNEDSNRAETADSDLNVKGTFSFVADDGVPRTVNYIAGSDTGFVAEGDHIPQADDVVAAAPAVYAVAPAPAPATLYSAPVVQSAPTVYSEGATGSEGDASYSFSYQNEDSNRAETADSDLNVKGTFSFVADDGASRTVNYVAGSETGFVAEGDHIPSGGAEASAAASKFRASHSGSSGSSSSSSSSSSSFHTSSSSSGVPATHFSNIHASQPKVQAQPYSAPSVISGTSGHRSSVVGNVKLHEYPVLPGRVKYGYAFSEV